MHKAGRPNAARDDTVFALSCAMEQGYAGERRQERPAGVCRVDRVCREQRVERTQAQVVHVEVEAAVAV